MISEWIDLFRRNFLFIVREDATVRNILENKECKVIEKRNGQNVLIGSDVVHNNTILMLCVDQEYRNKGIGSELLSKAEQAVRDAGFEEVTVGAGYDYLMPCVPTSKRYTDAVNERLYEGLDAAASEFLRGFLFMMYSAMNARMNGPIIIPTGGKKIIPAIRPAMEYLTASLEPPVIFVKYGCAT